MVRFYCALFAATCATSLSCSKSYPGPKNPNFENGSLDGWEVISGDAFDDSAVSNASIYFDGPFGQNGEYFLWGYAKAGDPAVGELRSSTFQASSIMSFLVGGGYNPGKLYIGLVREEDGSLLLNQTGMNDEALIRVIWDTSQWEGEKVYLVAVDNDDGNSWGHINLDDVRTGCPALGDGDLTFTVMGQANQPVKSSSPCQVYAADPTRPQFHYTPYQGWINDPCGLIQWNGMHHRFAQFNPRAAVWDSMHWSHAVSKDGVHWKPQPIALYPPYPNDISDQSGRFTGSAVKDMSGQLRLVFTEWTMQDKHPGSVLETQWTASSKDGVSFNYFNGNPVIPAPPPDSGSGFRDPKVFWDTANRAWRAVVGSGDEKHGKIHMYGTTDLIHWQYVGVLFEGDGSTGNMWECPNFFPLGDKWVLFYGGNGRMVYHVGNYDGKVFTSSKMGLVDYGPAGYAGQWYKDDKGRNLAVSWMTTMGAYKEPSRINGWAGQHSFTRELFLTKSGGLGSRPIEEAKLLETGHSMSQFSGTVSSKTKLGSGNIARLRISVDLKRTSAKNILTTVLSSKAEGVKINVDLQRSVITLDTKSAGYGQAGAWEAPIDTSTGRLAVDILLDRSSLEVFVGDGTVLSARVFPRYQQSTDIHIEPIGGTVWLDKADVRELGSGWC